MGLIYQPGVTIGGDTCANYEDYDGNPRQPMINYSSITVPLANTVITYDHWEDGYEAAITFPAQSTTGVWGDGDLANGVAPGDPDDILVAGQVLILNSVMDQSTLQAVVDFDARDKIAATAPVAVSRATWSDGSKTLFAHADEVYPTDFWGVDYRLPVGENADLNEMFEYTGVSVMASVDGTVVSIDKDANGSAEQTCNLNEGESCQWTDGSGSGVIGSGLNRHSRISANAGHPIQVNLVTGDYCAGFETRSFPLLPVDKWSASYYNPAGTLTSAGGPGSDEAPTYVHLYNPNASIITINYAMGGGAYTPMTIAPQQGAYVQMTDAMGAHFYSSSASGATINQFVRDEFGSQLYSNQDGDYAWTSLWDETGDDDDPASGSIQINTSSDHLRFYTGLSSSTVGDMIEREVNLNGATAATLSFAYSNNNGNAADRLQILASSDGGSSWTQVGALIAGNTSGSFSQSITSYISGNTRVRIRISGNSGDSDNNEYISVDNVNIAATFPGAGSALPFFAVATVDSENAPSNSGTDRNDRYDWGITLVPERLMSQWLIVGWAPGDDPTFLGAAAENSAPIWLTGGHPTGSSTPTATFNVCIDDGGNGGGTTDPITGRTYDRQITGIAPRSQQKVYNGGSPVAGQDQTAMQIWVCDGSDAIITAAWGEDPLTAAPASPAMDMGDTVRNGPRWRVTKDVALWIDVNGNGLYDEGDTIRYTIEVVNQGSVALPINSITVVDTPDPGTTYVLNSTTVDFGSGPSAIPDNGVGTPFPLDTPGYSNGMAIPVNGSMTIVFDAKIDAGTGSTTVCNGVTADDGSVEQAASACAPVQEPVLSAIGNYVWFDEDGDGDQDAGEAGIPNVRVELWVDTDGNGSYETLVATTYTDANGGYLFPDLDAGEYRVDVISSTLPDPDGAGPGGLHQTYDEDNGTGPFTTPHSTTVSLGSGVEHLTADFGYNWAPPASTNNPPSGATGAIGDHVWIDNDGDGVQDTGEAGIPGVTVELWYDSDGDGDVDAMLSSTTTDAAGNYIFDNLPAGIYEVRIPTPPAGYTQTGDPDNFGAPCATACDNQTTTPIVLGPGDVFLNADFGYQPPPAQDNSIGNKVWLDIDADGVGPGGNGASPGNDNNETGIPGVTVALIRDLDNDGIWDVGEPIIATTVTDANGDYLFDGLPDGSYLVWVNDTENVLGEVTPTYDSNGGTAPSNSSAPTGVNSNSVLGISSVINLGVGSSSPVNNTAQDFGYTPAGQTLTTGAIGDTVFLDADGDNNFDQGEGLEGVVVVLYDNNGVKIAQTTTDENGHYYFGNLPVSGPGVTYVVQVQTSTLPNNGVGLTNHVDPDDPNPGDSFSTVTLTTAAPINLAQDFGYIPANPGSIGNLIWEDTNADGNVDPGENGIGGVTVDLYEDSNNNGVIDSGDNLVGQTVTNSSGGYLFPNLPAGNYLVDVTDDAGVLNGYWHSTGTPGADNNSQADPHAVTLAAGQNYVAADFGYYVEPAAVGNFVWLDSDNDGIQDAGEAGISNVVVKLTVTWPNGQTTVLTTVTDSTGYYSFGNLLQDEDYNGDGSGSEPTFSISIDTSQPALSGSPYPTLINAPGSNQFNDSNNPAGTPAQPVQGQTNTSFANNGAPIASYDFGFRLTPLAVVLADFAAGAQTDHVLVTWETASELENAGFNLYRSATDAAPELLLANVPSSAPGSAQGAFYSYQDFDVQAGQQYFYWLEAVDLNGSTALHGPVSAFVQSPTAVTLSDVQADSGAGNLLWLVVAAVAGLALAAVYRLRRSAAR